MLMKIHVSWNCVSLRNPGVASGSTQNIFFKIHEMATQNVEEHHTGSASELGDLATVFFYF
jgi:hypothetical protein